MGFNDINTTRDVISHSLKYISGDVLDLGAGTAKYHFLIKTKAKKYVTYDMVAGDNIDIVGDVLDISLPDASFDTVISTQVLEHVEKPWVMIHEICRVLRKDGTCVLSAPFFVPYHADPNDFFRYTKNGLISLFSNNGFEIVESENYGKVFSVLSEYIHFRYFNPYGRTNGRLAKKFLHILEKSLIFIDRFVGNKIVYPNSFIIAKKK